MYWPHGHISYDKLPVSFSVVLKAACRCSKDTLFQGHIKATVSPKLIYPSTSSIVQQYLRNSGLPISGILTITIAIWRPQMSGQTPSSGSQHHNVLAFRPKEPKADTGDESRPKVNLTTLSFRPKSDNTASDSKDGTVSGQAPPGKSTPDGKKMSDEDLAKYVARLAKEKSWPEIVQELLQAGVVDQDFVEEQLIATVLRINTYGEE
jgi:hypothetical protein